MHSLRNHSPFLPPEPPVTADMRMRQLLMTVHVVALVGLLAVFGFPIVYCAGVMLVATGAAFFFRANSASIWRSQVVRLRRSFAIIVGMVLFWVTYFALDAHGYLWPEPPKHSPELGLPEALFRVWTFWFCIIWLALRFGKGLWCLVTGKAVLADRH